MLKGLKGGLVVSKVGFMGTGGRLVRGKEISVAHVSYQGQMVRSGNQ